MGIVGKLRERWGGREREKLAVRPVNLDRDAITTLGTYRQSWQEQGWSYYRDNVGEFASVVNWRANAISRIDLFPARLDTSSDQIVPEPAREPILNRMLESLGSGGDTGYSQMLKRMSIHLDVPGETNLVTHRFASGAVVNFVASSEQLTAFNGGVGVRIDEYGVRDDRGRDISILPVDGDNTRIRRILEPDPAYPWLAISPARYARKILRVVDRLTDRVNANTLSRMTNKVWLLSDAVQLPGAPASAAAIHDDPQMAGLIYAASVAAENPESPAATIPIIGRVSVPEGSSLADMHDEIDFGSEFDQQLVPLFDLFIRRLALTLNTPPEILLGVTDANHWSAYMVSDDTVRVHLAPTIELICDALTRAYLRPAIVDYNRDVSAGEQLDPAAYTVWYDTARLVQRPNRAESALANYGVGLIGSEPARMAGGWDVTDAPDAYETRQRILTEALANNTPAEEVQWYLEQLRLWDVPEPADGSGAAPALPAGSVPRVAPSINQGL